MSSRAKYTTNSYMDETISNSKFLDFFLARDDWCSMTGVQCRFLHVTSLTESCWSFNVLSLEGETLTDTAQSWATWDTEWALHSLFAHLQKNYWEQCLDELAKGVVSVWWEPYRVTLLMFPSCIANLSQYTEHYKTQQVAHTTSTIYHMFSWTHHGLYVFVWQVDACFLCERGTFWADFTRL